MKLKFAFWILVLFSLGASCEKDNNEPADTDIFGYWRYQTGVVPLVEDPVTEMNPLAHLQLNEDGTLSGFTSRNILGGTFTHDSSGNIKLNINMMTRVADTPWSARFTQMVEEADRYRLEGNTLTLINSGNSEEFSFLKMSPEVCKPVPNDTDVYQNAQSDPFELIDVKIAGPCLEVRIGYGGGCKEVDVQLIGGGAYAESLPPQLAAKIVLDDDDNCEAYVMRNYYFDLKELQYEGLSELQLNLEGWEDPILVRYEN